MSKKEFRNHLIQQRKQKTDRFIDRKSEKIEKTVLSLPFFKKGVHILFYVSYNGEVNTHQLIKKSLSLNKHVYVPISKPKTHTLIISELHQFSDLRNGTYGILEPIKEKTYPVPINQIEIIIVPGVGFDEYGHRIGQGGGYYDWLLSNTKTTSIALAFEFQIHDDIPIETHDKKVDIIVTEKRVLYCNQKLRDELI